MEAGHAFARFFTQLARAADELAAELTRQEAATDDGATLAGLGSRQRQAFDALRAARRDLKTGEIADAIHYDFSNCWMTLRRLEQLRLVELVPGSRPQRWRLLSSS